MGSRRAKAAGHPATEDAASVATKPDTITTSAPLAEDLLSGINAISDYTGEPHRRAYRLCEEKERSGFPAFKRHGRWYSRRSWLDAYYSGETVELPA
jgi:hypothetical protein